MTEQTLSNSYEELTPRYDTKLQEVLLRNPERIVVLVLNNAAMMKLTCDNRAMPSQVIVQKTMMLKKGNMSGASSITKKFIVQIHCKLDEGE